MYIYDISNLRVNVLENIPNITVCVAALERQTRPMSETSARILVHACPCHTFSRICDYKETWRVCVDMVFGSIIGCCSKTAWIVC